MDIQVILYLSPFVVIGILIFSFGYIVGNRRQQAISRQQSAESFEQGKRQGKEETLNGAEVKTLIDGAYAKGKEAGHQETLNGAEVKTLIDGAYAKGKEAGHQEFIMSMRKEMKSIMEDIDKEKNAYLKGKEAGRNEAFKDFTVTVQPFHHKDKKMFSSEYRGGYRMQLLIKGLPIGEPIERVIHYEKLIDEERAEFLLKSVISTTSTLIGQLIEAKMGVKELPIDKRSS